MYYNTGKYKLCYICILLVRVGQFRGTYFQNIGLLSIGTSCTVALSPLRHNQSMYILIFHTADDHWRRWSLSTCFTFEIKWFQKALALFRDCISAFSFAFKRAMIHVQKCKLQWGKWEDGESKVAKVQISIAEVQRCKRKIYYN